LAHPVSYTMSTGSFPGVKWTERGVDHPLPSSAEVKERVDLYLYSLSGPSWPLLGRTLLHTLIIQLIILTYQNGVFSCVRATRISFSLPMEISRFCPDSCISLCLTLTPKSNQASSLLHSNSHLALQTRRLRFVLFPSFSLSSCIAIRVKMG